MLEEFYQENYPIVYGYLLSLCGDPALAEELAAETFCRAIEKINRYDPKYKMTTWLCSIGKNLCYTECRRRKHLAELDICTAVLPSAESICLQKQEAKQLCRIVRELPEPIRQLVMMRLQGMTFAQIAEALDKSENWARVTFFRTRQKIRAEMEGTK